MTSLDNYQKTTVDWRSALRQNSRRTYFVIGLFFLIYLSLGLLVDTLLYSGTYPRAELSQIVEALLTLQLFPYATLIMAGVAAISLLVSYAFYDRLMLLGTEYHQVTPETAQSLEEKQLYNVIDELRIAAGLRYMPKVFIIDADYMNAFASGYSEKSAMVAITRGLMQKLDRDELQAVMAHELSHIRHMDIKITLTASLLANLMIIVLDILFYQAMLSNRRDDENRSRNGLFTVIMIVRYLLPIINVLLILYLSRKRELMADAGCVELTRNNEPLARALMKISGDYHEHRDEYAEISNNTPHENVRREAYIFDPLEAGIRPMMSISDAFSTHPSLETRLAALGFKKRP